MDKLIIVRYSEIGLKAKETRKKLEKILVKNIKQALKIKNISNKITYTHDRIFIHTKAPKKTISVLKRIFGIKSVSPAIKTSSDIDSIVKKAVEISKEFLRDDKSFAVRVTREGKHSYTSQDVAVTVGNAIRIETNAKVNLTKPDFTLFIEIKGDNAYLYTQKIEGVGGLPVGAQGDVLVIVDSYRAILSAWYMLKRGCNVKFVARDKSLVDNITLFAKQWFLGTDNILLEKDVDEIVSEGNYRAVITNHSLDKKSLEEIKNLKKKINIVILNPLIAMSEKEIEKKCKEIGLI